MKVIHYDKAQDFIDDTFSLLSEHEVQNNLIMSIAAQGREADISRWLLATVKDEVGAVLLTAVCTLPFNLMLYASGNKCRNEAVQTLARELRDLRFYISGVTAERQLAWRFAEFYQGGAPYRVHMAMNVMMLTQTPPLPKTPGLARPLTVDDLYFAPYWEREFAVECGVEVFDMPTNIAHVRERLEKDCHYIWEHGVPVAQAVHGRSTPNGAVVTSVYTPPPYRGHGYASACVAHLSRQLLSRGYKFCALLADAANPISNRIYYKIGYRDVCVFEEIKFGG